MSEHALKCENNAKLSKTILKLFISFKISFFCCFGFMGNLEFLDFPPIFFILEKSFGSFIAPDILILRMSIP